MDSVERSAVTHKKSRLARTFAKVLHIRAFTEISPGDGIKKVNSQKNIKKNVSRDNRSTTVSQSFEEQDNEEKLRSRLAMEALLAKLFASLSSIKAAYAQLQVSQSPYDADGIQSADEIVVSELKILSEMKQCFSEKQFDPSPEKTLILAGIQEQKSLLKTYEIMGNKLESQMKLKGSEIIFLREKLEEGNKQNKLIEKKLHSSGQLLAFDNLQLSGINPTHFITVLRNTIKSIRNFVRVLVNEMELAGWDIDAAANAIVPGVSYWKNSHKCYAFESFVCREMFESFHIPNFSLPNEILPEKISKKHHFFNNFSKLKSIKGADFLSQNPKSTFAKFCRVKYLQVVHSKMELSFFGDLNQRNIINAGKFPDSSPFFASFTEMSKRVWLLHCLSFAFEPEASIFQVSKNSPFSEVYMESVTDEAFMSPESDPRVSFTVFPGFTVGKTVVQCLVYLSNDQESSNVVDH